jgi:tripeptide aminopeptidase
MTTLTLADIHQRLPEFSQRLRTMQETLLANLVMVGELPAPTFEEHDRLAFVCQRFTEYGLINASTDEVGNAVGIRPGRDGNRSILLVAHADSNYADDHDPTVVVLPDRVTGPGVADNALGVTGLMVLPLILDHLGVQLDSDLVLMASSRSLGKGNIEGARFFLDNVQRHIDHGICLEGAQIERLSYSSVGMFRGEIDCQVAETSEWSGHWGTSAIHALNEVINSILEIPLPSRPSCSIVLGSVEGGDGGYNHVATNATLRFEIRSEDQTMVREIRERIETIVAEVNSILEATVSIRIFGHRAPGGLPFAHPLPTAVRKSMQAMGIEPQITASVSELSAFIDQGIPAVRIGLSTATHLGKQKESIYLEPMYTGLAQLVGLLMAIDAGLCDA